jgi:hypothetical protein
MSATTDDTAVTASPAIDWQSVETAYRTTARSVREIAAAHSVSHPAVLKRAKRDGWTRASADERESPVQVAKSVATETAIAPAVAKPAATTPVTAQVRSSAAGIPAASVPPVKQGITAMLFKSPDPENPVSLALTSGHTCVVGPEFTEIPSMFHRAAVMAGCESSGPLTGELQKAAIQLEAERADQASAEETARASAAHDSKWFQRMVEDDPRSPLYRRRAQA